MSLSPPSNTTPQLIANYRCHTGENPLWNPVDRRLYWCDIPQGRIFRYDPARNMHEQYYEAGVVGGFTIESDGSLLLFMARGAVARLTNGELTSIISEIRDETESRFNDVLADPMGRVFCGTMATEARPGRLYRLDSDGKLTVMLDGILCSNGMAFSLDRSQMYYADSFAREIYVFDFDRHTGSIRHKRVFVKTAESDGFPDGMTIDAEGYLWSAQWDGSCLIRYTPEGKEDRRVYFPTLKVSSVTFGGNDYSDMYVTTAGGDDPATNGEHAGALFRVNPGVRGVAEFYSRLGPVPQLSRNHLGPARSI